MSNFVKDLDRGKKGENFINDNFPELELISEPYGADFKCKNTGHLIELKTDFYDFNKTPNFFIERYSNYDTKRDGGVHQAIKYGAQWFMYLFYSDKVLYTFRVNDLIRFIDDNEHKFKPSFVMNRSYRTMGYKINRGELMNTIKVYEKRFK